MYIKIHHTEWVSVVKPRAIEIRIEKNIVVWLVYYYFKFLMKDAKRDSRFSADHR